MAGDKSARERVIAVDWALSKERWKEEKAKIEDAGEDVEMSDASAYGKNVEDSEEDNEDSEGGDLGLHNEENDDSDSHDSDSEDGDGGEDVEEPVKPSLPPPETGTTLFIRNVPFQATEDEFRTL
jgi:nucleolar protein 4